jgi:hypothetical protein
MKNLTGQKYKPFHGSSFLELPLVLRKRKAIKNPKNYNDNECGKWSVIIGLHPEIKHIERISVLKKFENDVNFSGISFPVSYEDWNIFEKQNPEISIQLVKCDENCELHRLRISSYKTRKYKIILLLIEKEVNEIYYSHYCYVKSLSRATGKSHHKKLFCQYCMKQYSNENKLKQHEEYCINNDYKINIFLYKNKNELNNNKIRQLKIEKRQLEIEKKFNEQLNIKKMERKNIQKCISNCRYLDKKKLDWIGRGKLDHVGNITYCDIINLLKKQNYKCHICGDVVLTHSYAPFCAYKFSIDRIDNDEPHDVSNVKISCYYCNCKDHIAYNQIHPTKTKCNNKCACIDL